MFHIISSKQERGIIICLNWYMICMKSLIYIIQFSKQWSMNYLRYYEYLAKIAISYQVFYTTRLFACVEWNILGYQQEIK